MSKKRIADIIINLIMFISTAYALLCYFLGPADAFGSHGVACFKFFTTDSNILVAVASLLCAIFLFKKTEIPQWVMVLKFAGTISVTVTFLTVLLFLAPMGVLKTGHFETVFLYFAGNAFLLHFSTPVLSIISTTILEKEYPISKKQSLCGVLPTLVYAVIYLFMVVIFHKWEDFYGFTFGGRYQFVPIVIIVMGLFSLILCLCEYKIMNHKGAKKD
ncbi:MAG: hypothetical protein MJ160_02940 [Treponema sp.]|nr:hypothetical protein [Treponema sp.]